MSICNFVFSGNLGRDAELKYTQGGDPILGFAVAVTTGYGEKKITTWWNCTLFGKRAEAVAKFMTKGKSVIVIGEPSERSWMKDGEKKKMMQVNVREIDFSGGRKEGSPAEHRPDPNSASAGTDYTGADENVPF